MLRLYILRHAKASLATPGVRDFDRSLSNRGMEDARHVAEVMRAQGYVPQVIACSPSMRTRMTLDGVRPAFGGMEPQTVFDQSLYHGGFDDYLAAMTGFSRARSGMVIGHNPNCEIVASTLCGGGDTHAVKILKEKFPTGALAVFDMDIDEWSQIRPGCGDLADFVIPREL
jgi:phosphohistidine phosphatase